MKKYFKSYLSIPLFFVGLLVQSCGTSSQYFTIDYLEPGKILFPERIENLVLVNNMKGNEETTTNLKELNVVKTDIFNGFVGALAETEYYNKLVIADDKWRSPKDEIISKDTFREMNQEISADAIISLEQLQFRDLNTTIFYPEMYTDYKVVIAPSIQIYNAKNNAVQQLASLDTIQITDALIYASAISRNHQFRPEEYPYSGAYILGQSLAKLLAPYWETADRMLYTDTPVFKTANKYYEQNQLEEAIKEYTSIAEKKDKPVNSIKAAYNAAITYELMDNLQEAYKWAYKSLEIAQDHFNITDTQLNIILYEQNDVYYNSLLYTKLISKRINDKQLLEMQMNRFHQEK